MHKSDLTVLAHLRREDGLALLRDGVRFRSAVIESGRLYNRTVKHKHRTEQ